MSKKRTSPGTSPDDQTNEKDPKSRHDDDTKRVKLISPSDTKFQLELHDLPLELFHYILVRAIVMELKEMNLANSVWKERADLVLTRLKTVCPHWKNILTTSSFQNELYRTLDRTVEKTIRLEIVHKSPLPFYVFNAVTLKDELFVLCQPTAGGVRAINVYDRNNLPEVKDVIRLAKREPRHMASCSVSNCLYILSSPTIGHVIVVRITKADEDEHQFTIQPLIRDEWRPSGLSVAVNGDLILYEYRPNNMERKPKIFVYDATGHVKHRVILPLCLNTFEAMVPMPNGNLVIALESLDAVTRHYQTKLVQIDRNGTILRQYQSALDAFEGGCLADERGRILIWEKLAEMELLDKEFNRLKVIGPKLDEDQFCYSSGWHYCGERNELVTILKDSNSGSFLVVLQFKEK